MQARFAASEALQDLCDRCYTMKMKARIVHAQSSACRAWTILNVFAQCIASMMD